MKLFVSKIALILAAILMATVVTESAFAGDWAAGKAIFNAKCHRCHAALPYTGRVKNLAAFLLNPRKVNPKTAMTFRGLKSKKDIDDVIAYITSGRR